MIAIARGCTASLIYCDVFARSDTASLLYCNLAGRSLDVNFFVKALKGRGILARGKAPRMQDDKIKPYKGEVIYVHRTPPVSLLIGLNKYIGRNIQAAVYLSNHF